MHPGRDETVRGLDVFDSKRTVIGRNGERRRNNTAITRSDIRKSIQSLPRILERISRVEVREWTGVE